MKYIPGRSQSKDYLLDKNWPENSISINNSLIVIGGLYGNKFALDNILESTDTNDILVFNGDFHWFDYRPEDFNYIQKNVNNNYAIWGNVEKELVRKNDVGLGCGCAYPNSINDIVVDRSNEIHQQLKRNKIINTKINNLPSTLTFNINEFKIGITHGDEKYIAGWDCSLEKLKQIERQKEIIKWMKFYDIDILATTHTCGTAFLYSDDHQKIISNNGAAGMPNFKGTNFGLSTRISISNRNKHAVYSQSITKNNQKIYVELVPIQYSQNKYIKWFDSIWPKGTSAEKSYRNRIIKGPNITLNDSIIEI
ncbi:hypothetical protein [Facklamia lactis]|uniref:hypothetical protein n=1 Tax=Facklamia lactis TaxID=2749967 RepID=UPI0018CDC2FB|nr:hypothetical protein [Facklamia lactis]MBG9980552.1 calcineurin phosphoesterase [Facklamia lactis]